MPIVSLSEACLKAQWEIFKGQDRLGLNRKEDTCISCLKKKKL